MKDIKLFHSNQIRSVWSEEQGEWLFSVVDVVGALTDSPNPNNYWKVLKNRLKKEGNQSVTICNQLKLQSPKDSKYYKTDVANTEQILRVIQSIPSPKAEPFKQWLAQLGADRIHDIAAAEALNKEIDARMAARHDIRQHNVSLAEDKLRRENVHSKEEANKIHYSVGRVVRNTIKELGGTMPEKLPTPEESIKQIEKHKK